MKTVFTNGCFDILHIGHIKLLEYCKSLGDQVIVGLNSDRSVTGLKGPTRPVNHEQCRKYLLESLRFVDHVIIFDEDTPYQLITQIEPTIIVKGVDYDGSITDSKDPKYVVGSDLAEVRIFNTVEGHSTTNTLEKLKT